MVLIVLGYGAPIHFFSEKGILRRSISTLQRKVLCGKKGNSMPLCSLEQVSSKEKRKNISMEMVKPVTLSSQNRAIQSNIKHYLEKSYCQKENNLDDVMGVSNPKEHAGLHRL